MAERGFGRYVYVADDGTQWALSVDRDSAADPNRGWVPISEIDLPAAPRGLLPRRVVGVDDSGRQQTTRVAHTGAALWDGSATTWSVEASDGTIVTATVVLYQAERIIAPGHKDPL